MNIPTVRRHLAPLLPLLALAIEARGDSLNGLRSAVARVGDVNGDGVLDVAVASRDRNRPERVWILSGKDGARLLEIAGADRFGMAMHEVGDWDRDGVPDLLVVDRPRSEFRGDRTLGHRTIHSGQSGKPLAQFAGSGACGGARDLDGDGHLDLLLVEIEVGRRDAAVVVRSGKDGSALLVARDAEAEGRKTAPAADALAWIDDVDLDGRADLTAVLSRSVRLDKKGLAETRYELSTVSGRTGLVLWSKPLGGHEMDDLAMAAPIGDTNADGIGDLLCAVEDRFVWLLDGKDGSLRWERSLKSGMCFSHGSSLDRVGDVDRDGVEDWVIAANESWGDFFDAGLCSVRSGKTGETVLELREDRSFGFDASGVGDVNADGVPDFAVGAERQRGWTPDDSSEPAVQVRSGKDASILWMRRHVDLRQ